MIELELECWAEVGRVLQAFYRRSNTDCIPPNGALWSDEMLGINREWDNAELLQESLGDISRYEAHPMVFREQTAPTRRSA